jgi:hypothetical protein
VTSRATLGELREIVLDELDDQWITPSEITDTLELDHGPSWYRVALTLERLANDGLAELKTPGSTVRRFRRSRGYADNGPGPLKARPQLLQQQTRTRPRPHPDDYGSHNRQRGLVCLGGTLRSAPSTNTPQLLARNTWSR